MNQIIPMTGHTTESRFIECIRIDGELNAEDIEMIFMNKEAGSSRKSMSVK